MICTNKIIIFLILLALTGSNFVIFGFNPVHVMGDAGQYIQIAEGFADKSLYSSQEKSAFLLYREPGYPIFILAVFFVFGFGNLMPVVISQVILLALTAFLVYKILELLNYKKVGFWGAVSIAVLPPYIYYANLLLSEMFSTFLIVGSFYLTLTIALGRKGRGYYILLGLVLALLGLTRAHMLIFPILILFLFFRLKRARKDILVCGIVFMTIIIGWIGYMHIRTGELAITKGRQELHLYIRSVRSDLSYKDQIYYLLSWMKRSASGGSEDELVSKYDPGALIRQYSDLVGRGHSPEELKKQNISNIWDNRGQYILGNGVELIKLMFVEHLYPPVSSFYGRLVRLSMYGVIYGLFILGTLEFWRKRASIGLGVKKAEPVGIFVIVAGAYILYHWLILQFFDLIPRYNTPYLAIYLIVGLAGLAYRLPQNSEVGS